MSSQQLVHLNQQTFVNTITLKQEKTSKLLINLPMASALELRRCSLQLNTEGKPIEAITSTSVNVLHLEGCGKISSQQYKKTKRNDSYIIFIDDSGQEHYGVVKRFEVDPSLVIYAIINTISIIETIVPHLHTFQYQR